MLKWSLAGIVDALKVEIASDNISDGVADKAWKSQQETSSPSSDHAF